MMTLYASALSPFSARVRLVAALTGRDLNETPPPGGSGSDAMKAVSGFGKVPAIDVDGRILIESLALMEYLVDIADDATLRPDAAEDRAAMRGIILAHDHVVLAAAAPLFAQVRTPAPDMPVVKASLAAITVQYGVLAGLFGDGAPAVAGRFSLADAAIAPFALSFGRLYQVFGETSPFEVVPRLQTWWNAVGANPQVAQVTAAMGAAFDALFKR